MLKTTNSSFHWVAGWTGAFGKSHGNISTRSQCADERGMIKFGFGFGNFHLLEVFRCINLIYISLILAISSPLEKSHSHQNLKDVFFINTYSISSSFSCDHLAMVSEAENKNTNVLAINKEAEIDDLIAELCLNAPNDRIKFCIRNYQYGNSIDQIEKDFYRKKREVLCETAHCLKIPNYEMKNKETLARLAVCRIQNLLPEECALCSQCYRININPRTCKGFFRRC